jgi:hypothetical protein
VTALQSVVDKIHPEISEYEANASLNESLEQECFHTNFSEACSSSQEVITCGTLVQHSSDGVAKEASDILFREVSSENTSVVLF